MLVDWNEYWEWAGKNDIHRWTEDYYKRFLAETKPEVVTVPPEPTPVPPKRTVTVVNRSQQVRFDGLHPELAYSRLLTVGIAVGAGVGMTAMVRTDPVAHTFRINSIVVIISSMDPAAVAWVRWQLYIGRDRNASAAQVHATWEKLFPSCLAARHPDTRICGSISTRHTVKKMFKGGPWSLAPYLYNWSAVVGCDIEFIIEISEG